MIIACLLEFFSDNKLQTQDFHSENNAYNIEYKEDFPKRKAIFGSMAMHVFFHDIRIIEAASKTICSVDGDATIANFAFRPKLDKA